MQPPACLQIRRKLLLDWFKQAENGAAGCLVIAEIAQRTTAVWERRTPYIDAVAKTGANAIKFQPILPRRKHAGEPWRVKFSARMRPASITGSGWSFPKSSGMDWLSMRVTWAHLSFLRRFHLKPSNCSNESACPHGSGGGRNIEPAAARKNARTGKPVILSSGMSGWSELDGGGQLRADK